MNDPARHADSMREAYQTYLQGRGGVPARSVSQRLEPDSVGESSLAGMRGPYLQALPIANWSDNDWESFARSQSLHPNVTRAFKQEGFRQLYDFQERSVKTILNRDDTVITATTGRGKTEAWLIPILDRIVTAKRQEDSDSRTPTKALLLYPTKALAQDQFKRLVQILYRINRNLRQKEWVTVGIYDGDTPRNTYESKAQGYLNRTFQHFDCPGANDELEKCQRCRQGVFIERSTDDYRLRPDKPRCETDEDHKVPLDFVRLTKNSVLESGADIILTNPDTLNYRLLNINAETEQAAFVYDPSFLVFDEVHTYDGLLGSYTATLVKRLRRLREQNDCDPLQVIGSSATVDNDAELFRQISGATDISRVSEDPRTLTADSPEEIPSSLYEDVVSTDTIIEAIRKEGKAPSQVGDIELTIPEAESLDNDRLEERVADDLFDFYTSENPTDDVVKTLQALHTDLSNDPRSPEDFIQDCADRFDISAGQAETLVDNFQRIGQFAGLLESRNHLFSWPFDGFYACAACTAVYRSPQERCEVCAEDFVTRATYCRQCNEEYLVANACSRCGQLEPYVHTDEGLIGEDDHEMCSTCLSSSENSVPMHRVTFRPHHECTGCGTHEDRSVIDSCPDCGSPGVPTGDDEYTCRNPSCGHEWSKTHQCSECATTEFELATVPGPVACSECGEHHEQETVPLTCECGAEVRNTRLLPWVCPDASCDTVHFTPDPPEQCSCGSTDFAKGTLADLAVSLSCSECDGEAVPGGDCGCDAPDYQINERPHRKYRTWDADGNVISPLEHRNAMPCSHGLYSTVIGDAFDELLRSPTNVAVTTSQYLLRDLVDESGFEDAKLLSFSDSHRDMKDLDRAFTDPEIGTVLDQLILTSITLEKRAFTPDELEPEDIESLRPGSDRDDIEVADWVSLDAVTDTAYELLLELEAELGGDDIRSSAGIDLGAVILGTSFVSDQEQAIKSRLRRRAVRHVGERRGSGGVSLERDGLVDVRLDPGISDNLDHVEREVTNVLVGAGNNAREEDLVENSESKSAAATRLIQQEILVRRDDDRLALAPTVVELTNAGDGDISYDPDDNEYYSTLRQQSGQGEDAVECPDSLRDRANVSHPRFTERAYTASRNRISFLLSRLYYGSTPKMERREIEHRFRSEPSPNFLSSGPTMELGVDIGSLDALLMYGTPPNMNAYLQRVGRAGRSSHSSLVHSVSQRNPIDYYYYDEPTELITADKQPVPLNEHNARVLEISLTWAVFDYVASEFVIPWDVSRHDVSGGEEVVRRDTATIAQREDASKYTQLLAKSVSSLDLDEDSSRLRPLGITIEDDESEIRSHLESLLNYAYCPSCHRHYAAERSGETCPEEECDRTLIDAKAAHQECIDAAIQNVTEVFVDGYRSYTDRIRDRIDGLEDRRQDLVVKRDAATEQEEIERHERAIKQVDSRIDVLSNYLETLSGESYGDVLTEAFAEYAFNLRSVSDSVDISVVDESGEPTQIGDDQGGRSSRLALGELHPGAAYLHERRPHIVAQVFTDDKTSADLRDHVEETVDPEESPLTTEFICTECGDLSIDRTTGCGCGSSQWQERRLYSMDSVEATLDTQSLPNELDKAGSVYNQPSERVQNTFSRRQTEILRFDPSETFSLVSEDGDEVGSLAYGEYDILEYTDSFRAKYQSGGFDDSETKFQVCAEPDCPGIIYEDYEDTRRCSVNPDHSPDVQGTDVAYARFGYEYETEGVRLTLQAGIDATHTLAHGLRLALQKLSGVPIRDVSEHVGTDQVDVFDAQEGGAAVARQLIQEHNGEFQNFTTAMEMLETQLRCDCTDGCPRCVYQYGCAERNQPRTFNLDSVTSEVLEKRIRLRRLNIE